MSAAAAIVDRWARAIVELGAEANQQRPLVEQLGRMAQTWAGSPELRAVLDNPRVEEGQRDAVLKAVATRLGLTELATNTVRLLARRRRLHLLPDVARRAAVLVNQATGVVTATVVSAQPLPEAYVQKLVQRLEKATQRKVVLDKQVDPTLIGGVIARIGDHTIDGSLAGRLQQLGRAFQRA